MHIYWVCHGWKRLALCMIYFSERIGQLSFPSKDDSQNTQMHPYKLVNASLHEDLQPEIHSLFKEFKDIWESPKYGQCTVEKHAIITRSAPICFRPRRLSPKHQIVLREHITQLLKEGVIQKSKSSWAAPIVLVWRPNGDMRLCIDYREINKVTKSDAYPLPLIDDLMQNMKKAKYFSTIDLKSGYYLIQMKEESIEKTAFITPEGLYEFLVMPFGLKNAPATFQRMMHTVLGDLKTKGVSIYLDDIIIFTSDKATHQILLREVFFRLRSAQLYINIQKSHFMKSHVIYLGFKIGNGEMSIDETRREAMSRLDRPKNVKGIRRLPIARKMLSS